MVEKLILVLEKSSLLIHGDKKTYWFLWYVTGQMGNDTNVSLSISYSAFQTGYHSVLILLALLIFVVNLYVLYLYIKTYTLRIGTTNRLLANLAFSDLLTALITIPVTITSASLSGRTIPHFQLIYFASKVLSDFCTIYTVSSVALLMFDRYLLVCRPFCSFLTEPRVPSMKQIVFMHVLIMLIAVLPVTWSYKLLLDPEQPIKASFLVAEKIYAVTITVFFFLIPSCMILIGLVMMYASIRLSEAQEQTLPNRNSYDGTQYSVVVRYLIAFLTFMVCWLPLMTIRTIDCFTTELGNHLSQEVLEAVFTLRCAISLFNPFLYTWIDRDYKKIISKSYLFRKFMTCRTRMEETTELPWMQHWGIKSHVNTES